MTAHKVTFSPTSTIRPWISRFSGHFNPGWSVKHLITLKRFVQKRL
jgi:hypothetical protein